MSIIFDLPWELLSETTTFELGAYYCDNNLYKDILSRYGDLIVLEEFLPMDQRQFIPMFPYNDTVLGNYNGSKIMKHYIGHGVTGLRFEHTLNNVVTNFEDIAITIDVYGTVEHTYIIPEETQDFFIEKIGLELSRHMLSFLSPCASESIYPWDNTSERDDCLTPGHLITAKDYIELLNSNENHRIANRRHVILENHARVGFSKTLYHPQRGMPCFGIFQEMHRIRIFILMFAQECGIELTPSQVQFFYKSRPCSKKHLPDGNLRRVHMNILFYATAIYKHMVGVSSTMCLEKYPRFDSRIKRVAEAVDVRHKLHQETFSKCSLNATIVNIPERNKPSALVHEMYMVGLDIMDPESNDKFEALMEPILYDDSKKVITVHDENILQSAYDQRAWIKRDTKLIFPDKVCYARDVLRNGMIRRLNARLAKPERHHQLVRQCARAFRNWCDGYRLEQFEAQIRGMLAAKKFYEQPYLYGTHFIKNLDWLLDSTKRGIFERSAIRRAREQQEAFERMYAENPDLPGEVNPFETQRNGDY